jgi:hypothetical protein
LPHHFRTYSDRLIWTWDWVAGVEGGHRVRSPARGNPSRGRAVADHEPVDPLAEVRKLHKTAEWSAFKFGLKNRCDLAPRPIDHRQRRSVSRK